MNNHPSRTQSPAGRTARVSESSQCYFPSPPPKRTYCSPAPFTNPVGASYQRVVDAYGDSRPHYQ